MSFEFCPQGTAFVQEAVKVQADKTSAAWKEHNEKLSLMFTDVWVMIKEREHSINSLIGKYGGRHPIVQALKDAVVQEHVWLHACVQDNREGFARHCEHLETVTKN